MSPKSNASRHLVDVKSASPSRIERVANEYKSLCAEAADLELRKKELSAKLLRLTKSVAEPDDKGKLRTSTDSWDLVIIDSSSSKLDAKRLMKYGVSARVIKKSTIKTEYSYVGVFKKGEERERA